MKDILYCIFAAWRVTRHAHFFILADLLNCQFLYSVIDILLISSRLSLFLIYHGEMGIK